MKKCSVCKTEKSLDSFYKNTAGSELLMSRCKVCHIRLGKERRQKNPEQSRAQGRRNYSLRREAVLGYLKGYRTRNLFRKRAQNKVQKALLKGKLARTPCFCGNEKVDGHHPDYSKPLEVIWLCRKHHLEQEHTVPE